MSTAKHVCRWGEIQFWTPPSAYAPGTLDVSTRIPYRRCACGDTVWGAMTEAPQTLARLADPVAAERRR